MIYVDVSSSCKSPLNTGVQRVVRGFFRAMTEAELPVTPMAWDNRLRTYCTLSQGEEEFLRQPFAGRGKRAVANPGRLANPVPILSKAFRQVRRRGARFDLRARLTSGDVLFVPEIFQDHRIEWFSEKQRRLEAPHIAFFHDAIALRYPELTPPARQPRFLDYVKSLAAFDTVVTTSQEAAADLEDRWSHSSVRRAAEVVIAPLPVDPPFVAEVVPPPTDELPKILSVGTFEPRKNHLMLLEACEKLWRKSGPIFELVLIGRTTAHFGARVQNELKRVQKMGGKIDWRRHVDDRTLRAAYDEARFTIFPSLVEGYGLPIIESLRRGRPCICGSNGAIGELARGGGCLIVDQTDANALAGAILRLLQDEPLYQRLCDEASKREFKSWPEYLTSLRSVITPAVLV